MVALAIIATPHLATDDVLRSDTDPSGTGLFLFRRITIARDGDRVPW